MREGDAFALVADESGTAIGWAVVHIGFREDQDWDPPDEDTRNFQKDDNAYLENIEVTARARSGGIGSQAVGGGSRTKRGVAARSTSGSTRAKTTLMAHALFERQGWRMERTSTRRGSRARARASTEGPVEESRR